MCKDLSIRHAATQIWSPSQGWRGTAQGRRGGCELQQDRPAPAQGTGEQGQAKASVES